MKAIISGVDISDNSNYKKGDLLFNARYPIRYGQMNTHIDITIPVYVREGASSISSKRVNSVIESSMDTTKTLLSGLYQYWRSLDTHDKPELEKQILSSLSEQTLELDELKDIVSDLMDNESDNVLPSIDTNLLNYIDLFPVARSMKRNFIFHAGPTNSGKTHGAMQQLMSSPCGVYLAPLRLMAMEAYEKIKDNGIPVNLKTGEEIITDENAFHTASTIEMLNTSKEIDVAIIDEVQVMTDKDRGWAWIQAIIGCPAQTIIMTGSPEVAPLIEYLVSLTGDTYEIKEFQRLGKLEIYRQSVNVDSVKPGDAIVAFSRAGVLGIHNELTKGGIETSCIYGAMGPENRRIESRRFASGESQVLVATDAIGMGLNLPINRILFSSIKKYDGQRKRQLTQQELKQIAGRAGRYGIANIGYIGFFNSLYNQQNDWDYEENSEKQNTMSLLDKYLHKNNPLAQVSYFNIMPLPDVLKAIHAQNGGGLESCLKKFGQLMSETNSVFQYIMLDEHETMAQIMDEYGTNLDIETRYAYMGCPVRNLNDSDFLRQWISCHNDNDEVNIHDIKVGQQFIYQDEAESLVTKMGCYIWLSLRFPDIYVEHEKAVDLRNHYNGIVESFLRSRNRGIIEEKKKKHKIREEFISNWYDIYERIFNEPCPDMLIQKLQSKIENGSLTRYDIPYTGAKEQHAITLFVKNLKSFMDEYGRGREQKKEKKGKDYNHLLFNLLESNGIKNHGVTNTISLNERFGLPSKIKVNHYVDNEAHNIVIGSIMNAHTHQPSINHKHLLKSIEKQMSSQNVDPEDRHKALKVYDHVYDEMRKRFPKKFSRRG